MIIEIRKAGFVNKGAELMLHAALQKLKTRYPDATFVMAPTTEKSDHPFRKLVQLGFYPKASLWRYGIQWGNLANFAPRPLREMYGVVLDKEVDVVIDAAGFAYSDQWGDEPSVELAQSAKTWKKNGTRVILLPQALGPFTTDKIQAAMKTVVENVDLVFPRERVSYEHLTALTGEQAKIKQAPDFTNLISGVIPADFDVEQNRFCIVPNCRMLDKTDQQTRDAYLPFLITCTRYLLEKGAKPFVLVHEGKGDLALAEKLSAAVGGIPIVRESGPLEIKGILGACSGTLGSRFHGLVSALSQGVPALATGWSHKYQMLFEDYGFPEGLVQVTGDEAEIKRKLDLVTDDSARIAALIQTRTAQLKEQSEQMWQQVFEVIDQCQRSRPSAGAA
ncbi:polysaccharide pyruvyl transferase family protein [Stutzerimonas zhaodongensis]|uniref:Polysaccharide pyruvyl transferase family protein n=1 Tax=Stutzerimonas zhaodongensis TaxID=1176257 RepID=A0A3M2HNK9_9GAMM|nr:polysaccharide pyruvyl transferase family protein [Stutzerimonas zhaodongensis]MCQ2030439.1 polysaccharide pyruvyl transferase family protein [Stutzerimonas zhaodongensis]MCQ4317603.1 polysaccharide pyruvyl transferase family protein [Stutzerimonas zhaodongensis]RMH91301.1 polysaccharide pyruvyl transferase family protein [Stutzerimonas zhaodongensis]